MGNQAYGVETLGTRPRRRPGSVLAALAEWIESYRRTLRAGSEIAELMRLSDAQLAALGLRRETLARKILAKHGIVRGA